MLAVEDLSREKKFYGEGMGFTTSQADTPCLTYGAWPPEREPCENSTPVGPLRRLRAGSSQVSPLWPPGSRCR
jgi:hypothetical protein